jgi:uncharacterized membrane protein SpoIIM required for sporulation
MILDLPRFVEAERPCWSALEKTLEWLEHNRGGPLSIEDAERFHALYQRAADDLSRVAGFAAEGELQKYLAWLVSRAYAEIHESRNRMPFQPWRWFTAEFPRTFRKHSSAFQLALLLTLLGGIFGGLTIHYDPDARAVLMPFEGLQMTPAQRVARERQLQGAQMNGVKGRFSAELMTHNTEVSLTTLALGITFGLGTVIILFYNGVTLGAVVVDYITGGQTAFLMGWLLPHGVVEIPSILIAGQAGLVLAYALIGWGNRLSRPERMRAVSRDLVTLAGGFAILLVWAGVVEAFVSQYHEPVLPYSVKISFGLFELGALALFLALGGRSRRTGE